MQNYLSKKVKEQRIAQALLCATVFGIGVGATPHLVKGDNGYSIVMGNEAKAEEYKGTTGNVEWISGNGLPFPSATDLDTVYNDNNSAHNQQWNWRGIYTLVQGVPNTNNQVVGRGAASAVQMISRGNLGAGDGWRPVLEVQNTDPLIFGKKSGDIVKFGTLYVNNQKIRRPINPIRNGDIMNLNIPYGEISNNIIEIKDTDEDDIYKVQWIYIKDGDKNLLIADRNLLTTLSSNIQHLYPYLDKQGLIMGRTFNIEGKDYKCRVLYGGNTAKVIGSGWAVPIDYDNEWDRYISMEYWKQEIDKVYNLDEVQKYGSWADAYYGKDLLENKFNYFTSSSSKKFTGVIDDSEVAKKFVLPNGRVITIDNYGMVNDYKTFTTTQPVTVPIDGTTIKGDIFLGNIDGKGLVPMFEKNDGFIWYIDTDNQARMLPIEKTDYTDTLVYHLANNVSNKFLFIKNDGNLVSFDSNRFEKETAINMNDVEKILPATNVTADLFLMKDGTMKNLDGAIVNFQGKKLVKMLSNRYLVMDDNMIYTLQGTTIKTTNTLATLYNKAVNDLLWLKNGKVMRADTSGNVSFLNDVNGALVKDIVKVDETGSFILMKDNTTKAYGSISSCGDLVAKGIDYNHIAGFMSDNTSNTNKKFIVMDDGTLYHFNGSKNTNIHLAGDVAIQVQKASGFVFDSADLVDKKINGLKDKPFVTADEKQELKDLVNKLPDNKLIELQPIIDEIMKKPEKPTDTEAPTATVAADKTNWTNTDVKLTVTATDNVEVKSITLPDDKVVIGTTATFVADKNGKYSFIIEDTAGNKKTIEYTVSNIDKEAPVVKIAEKDDKVIVESNDNESGIAKKYFKLDNGEWVETMPELTGLKDGAHTLQAKAIDLAGNESEITSLDFNINNESKDYAEKVTNATNAVIKAESSKLQADVDTARTLVSGLNDSDKTSLNARLDAVQKAIDEAKAYAEKVTNATNAVVKAESSKLQADVDSARTLVSGLNDTDKAPLNARLDAVQKAIDEAKAYANKVANATTAVVKAEGSKLQADVDSARTLVSGLNDSDKTSLNARLDVVQKAIDVQTILDELDKLADKIKDGTANQSDLDKIKDLVDELPKSEEKDDLQKQIDDAQKAIDEAKAEVDKKAKEDAATKLVEKAEQTKNQKDLDKAKNAVNELEDSSIKTDLTDKINEIQKAIDAIKADKELQQKALAEATALVEKAEQSKTRADYDIAVSAVKALPVMPGKVELQRRLDKLNVEMLKEESKAKQQEYENMKAAESAIKKASITKKDEDIAKAQELLNKLKDGPNKDRLQNWLDSFAPKDDSKLTSGDIYNLQKDAEKALKKAEVYRTQTDIDVAQEAIDKIPDRISTKAIYQARLDKVTVKDGTGSSSNNTYANVLALRNAEKVLKKAELNHSAEDIKVAEELVNALVPSDKKELFALRVNAEKLMQKAETEPSQENLDAVRESIEELPYGMVKYQLLRRISVVQKSLK